jgi:hypothetical protein
MPFCQIIMTFYAKNPLYKAKAKGFVYPFSPSLHTVWVELRTGDLQESDFPLPTLTYPARNVING